MAYLKVRVTHRLAARSAGLTSGLKDIMIKAHGAGKVIKKYKCANQAR
jgi:hypothetical protein